MGAVAGKKGAEPKRNYTQQTLKILFALSGNRCAEPGCSEAIIASPTASSPALVVGQIAHIYAISEDGPRGKTGLTAKELNQVSNLILLCPTHHVKVDGQFATYPVRFDQSGKRPRAAIALRIRATSLSASLRSTFDFFGNVPSCTALDRA